MAGGVPIRERLPNERAPDPCDFGCAGDHECMVEREGFDAEAQEVVQAWSLCGGVERRCWPRAGGLDDQDAGTVAIFAAIDGLIASERQREAKRAEIAAGRARRQ